MNIGDDVIIKHDGKLIKGRVTGTLAEGEYRITVTTEPVSREELTELIALAKRLAPADLVLIPISEATGDHMTLENWKECCDDGGFIEYDGHGYLATENHVSNIRICPSQWDTFEYRAWATHIVWHNR